MGSPLSPILSNIYMELTEFYHILPHPLLNNSLWIRYVEDIFISLPHNTNPNDVLNYINSIHPSVQYTIEMPSNNSIPFLDTLITWNNNYLQFTIYRKPTFAPNYIHCLLYTSDAADERSSVDLGGRRIIKKKKKKR